MLETTFSFLGTHGYAHIMLRVLCSTPFWKGGVIYLETTLSFLGAHGYVKKCNASRVGNSCRPL